MPKDMPKDIQLAIQKVQENLDEWSFAYNPTCQVNTDIAVYAMVTSEDFTKYIYTFYNNYNYDTAVLITKTRIDFNEI